MKSPIVRLCGGLLCGWLMLGATLAPAGVPDEGRGQIYLTGAVRSRGAYDLPAEPLLLMKALALAGGPADLANLRKVRVIRKVNGEETVFFLDVGKPSKEAAEFVLEANDVVFVPEKILVFRGAGRRAAVEVPLSD